MAKPSWSKEDPMSQWSEYKWLRFQQNPDKPDEHWKKSIACELVEISRNVPSTDNKTTDVLRVKEIDELTGEYTGKLYSINMTAAIQKIVDGANRTGGVLPVGCRFKIEYTGRVPLKSNPAYKVKTFDFYLDETSIPENHVPQQKAPSLEEIADSLTEQDLEIVAQLQMQPKKNDVAGSTGAPRGKTPRKQPTPPEEKTSTDNYDDLPF